MSSNLSFQIIPVIPNPLSYRTVNRGAVCPDLIKVVLQPRQHFGPCRGLGHGHAPRDDSVKLLFDLFASDWMQILMPLGTAGLPLVLVKVLTCSDLVLIGAHVSDTLLTAISAAQSNPREHP